MSARSGAWSAVTASVRGGAHERDGKPNQDAVRVVTARGRSGLVAAVCDGHGGGRYVRSDVGSRLGTEVACEVGRRFLEGARTDRVSIDIAARLAGEVAPEITELWRRRVLDDVDRRPFDAAEQRRAGVALDADPLIAYGCTLLLAILADDWIGLLQIGDGDITAVHDARADAPVPGDERLVGGETTSLCLPTAAADARVAVIETPLPDLLILTSDGYANSFASPSWRTEAGVDLRDQCKELGIDGVEARLPQWLAESAAAGGDDVTMALIARTAAMVGSSAATAETSAPSFVRSGGRRERRALVPIAVVLALMAGGALGWLIGRGDGDEPPATPAAASSLPAATPSSASPTLAATTSSSSSSTTTSTSVATPTSTSTTSTTPTPDQPRVALAPGDLVVALDGPQGGVVLAFEAFAEPYPGVAAFLAASAPRAAQLAEGWTFEAGLLRKGEACYPVSAIGRAADRVWALSPDGLTLLALEETTGELLGAAPINGAIGNSRPAIGDCASDDGDATDTTDATDAAGVGEPVAGSTTTTTTDLDREED